MNQIGRRTVGFENRTAIVSKATIAGKKEKEGPLGKCFDETYEDDLLGQNTWEKAESEMLRRTVVLCAKKAGMNPGDIGALLAGDLNAQIISSGFAARELGVPFIGMYGACSTMTEGMLTAACLVDGGAAENAVCAASSHFCTAERQFRTPLELGTQRPPSAQWTATAAGAVMLKKDKNADVFITGATIGRVIDMKIKDSNQMGAAMAPAVMDTLLGHLEDTGRSENEFDLIVTGDLGKIGTEIL
jgi:stage V sporulation protein AD